jgi:hypothetical protein
MHREKLTQFRLVGVTKLASVKGAENINACIYEAPFVDGHVKARVISWPISKVECNIDYTPGTFFLYVMGEKFEFTGAFHVQEPEIVTFVRDFIRERI